jgi:aspartate carbamoyltransferase catalytic subunit
MPAKQRSLLDLKAFQPQQVQALFSLAKKIKQEKQPLIVSGETIALLFFEASTRTRMSFETAGHRVGLSPLLLDGGMKSSLEKGESIEDSVMNVAAMKPKIVVIRCGDQVDLAEVSARIQAPMINAGWGSQGHPTQALLDAFTMREWLGDLQGKRILFVGDIRHSRVAASHFELCRVLGLQIALSAPPEFLPEKHEYRIYEKLEDGLENCDVLMVFRCQFERHESGFQMFSVQEYREKFGLNNRRLKALTSNGLIMHPGPINHGIELESEVLADPRCRVLDQVTHGVYLREALLRNLLEGGL